MSALARFAREVAQAPHYRRRPIATLRYAYAKWIFHRFRQNDPLRFLGDLGIDPINQNMIARGHTVLVTALL